MHHIAIGSGPALVLLHPVGLDSSFWGGLFERLRNSCTIIAIDLPGHGLSGPAPESGIAAYSAAVADLLGQLGIGRAGLLGLSFGGMIAQEVAIRYPALVSRLVVGACGGRVPTEARAALRDRGEKALASGMTAVADETLTRWFTPDFMASHAVARVRDRLLANDPAGWAAGWKAIAGFDAFDRLPALAIPTLAVAGERDAGTPIEATRAIASAIPDARFAILPGAPHMMQIEQPTPFADIVMAFLNETSERS